MSIVGPRPDVKEFIDSLEIKDREMILSIKPGITGISSNDGSLQTFRSDPKNTPKDLFQNDSQNNKLEIIFKDSSGKQKKLIIDYK